MTGALLDFDLWDVGQGDCTVFKLPSGKLLIIDVGPKGSPLIDWLNERQPKVGIEAIVLTHNDADHAGALPSVIAEHKRSIGGIWMLLDRQINDPRFQKIFRAALQGESEGHYQIRRVEIGEVLWSDPASATELRVIHPSFSQNIQAAAPNDSSGVVVLESQGRRLFGWPGDLELRTAADVLATKRPWMLSGPHHGGPTDYPTKALRKRFPKAALINRMKEIRAAATALSPPRAFISVGTKNQHHHPRPGYLRLLASIRTRVSCSQLTFCCEREAVNKRQHILQGSALLGLRPARCGVSCRGSMRLHLKDGALFPDSFDSLHLERVSALFRPQCLRGTGWRRGDDLPRFAGEI